MGHEGESPVQKYRLKGDKKQMCFSCLEEFMISYDCQEQSLMSKTYIEGFVYVGTREPVH